MSILRSCQIQKQEKNIGLSTMTSDKKRTSQLTLLHNKMIHGKSSIS